MKILILLMLVSFSAHADWEIGVGRSVFQPSDNGIWWQAGLDHHLETESNSLMIGRTGRFDN